MLPVTPRPCAWSGVSVSNVSTSLRSSVCLCEVVVLRIELSATWLSAAFGPPALDYRVPIVEPVGMAGLEPASPCSQRPPLRGGARWVRRYPTSRLSVRTAGFEPRAPTRSVGRSWPPARRDTQASLRSDLSSPCGSRTRLFGLKGRCPQSDRRTSRLGARSLRSGPGGARTLVSWSSARRYAVSATSPTKKPGVACDTGFLDNPS